MLPLGFVVSHFLQATLSRSYFNKYFCICDIFAFPCDICVNYQNYSFVSGFILLWLPEKYSCRSKIAINGFLVTNKVATYKVIAQPSDRQEAVVGSTPDRNNLFD